MPQLRDYQVDCVLDILDAWSSGIQRPAVILPTGAGKTVVFATLCAMLARRGHKPLVLVARDELVTQTVAKLRDADDTLRIGVIQADRNELNGNVTVASVQTISRLRRLHAVPASRFDRLICDEAHWADSPSWRRVMEWFGVFDPDSQHHAVGFTATMARTGKHKLGEIWQEIVHEKDTRWAVEQGFLVRPRAQTIELPELDLDGVRTQHGDLCDADLGKAMSDAKAGPLIAAAYLDLARDDRGELRRGILFAPTVATAEAFMLDFRAAGIPTELVIGETPRAERQRVYALTDAGVNKVIASVGVLTTGFDLPSVEVAIMARPTKAKHLYVQMAGRVLRPSPTTNKQDALLLDCVGVSRFGLASIVDLRIHEEPQEREIDLDPLPYGGIRMAERPDAPGQIGFKEIDALTGDDEYSEIRRKLQRKKALTNTWLWTKAGTPFLPWNQSQDSCIFLWADAASCWTVGEMPKRGQVIWHESCLPFPEAVSAAYEHYPHAPRKLVGMASPAQLALLERYTREFDPDMTAQQASELISIEITSRRLDKVTR